MNRENIPSALAILVIIGLVIAGVVYNASVKCGTGEVKVRGSWGLVCVQGNYGR